MVEALGRVGTAAQKEAAPRVLQAMRDYQVNISEGYELESTHIAQLIQQLEVSPLADDCTTLAVTPWPTTARRWPSRRWSVS